MMIVNYDSDRMMSLFDYLGSPAGPALGARVYEEASGRGVPVKTKYVVTSRYRGEVMMYPQSFLQEYFGHDYKRNTK